MPDGGREESHVAAGKEGNEHDDQVVKDVPDEETVSMKRTSTPRQAFAKEISRDDDAGA